MVENGFSKRLRIGIFAQVLKSPRKNVKTRFPTDEEVTSTRWLEYNLPREGPFWITREESG